MGDIFFLFSLQIKSQTSKEQLSITRKQCEAAEEGVRSMEGRILDLVVQLDATKAQNTQLLQDKESLQKNYEVMRSEKNTLDKNRVELNGMVGFHQSI